MKQMCLSIRLKETGSRIKELLAQHKYTVRDVQEVMGFENPQAVYKWLSGKSLPSIDNMVILSKFLECSIEDILVVGGDFLFAVYCRHTSKIPCIDCKKHLCRGYFYERLH